MKNTSPEAERLRTAFELFEAGVNLMKASLKRRRPHASPEDIEALLAEWLVERPGAPFGDASGRSIAWPRVP